MSERATAGDGDEDLETLVGAARDGDRDALAALLAALRDDVYGLSLKMLWHPQDAEDAAQEILVKLMTRLDSYRGEAAFRTWAFRVASNHLLTTRKRRAERAAMSFEEFGRDLADGLSDRVTAASAQPERRLLEEEVKIGCTQGMLLCLDREHRLAYVLGEVFGVRSDEAAEIQGISAAAHRKRLQRARQRVRGFMREHCGLVAPDAGCRCERRVDRAVELGRVDPGGLLFAGQPLRDPEHPSVLRGVREMEDLHDAAAVFRSHPDVAAPEDLAERIEALLERADFSLLDD